MKGIDRTTIKWVAMGTMFIDHAAHTLLRGSDRWMQITHNVLRDIGRMAFPLFLFLLVDGFFRSRSREKYFLRLLIAAVVSEIPFNLMHSAYWQDPSAQNVMWTLLILFAYMWSTQIFIDLFAKIERFKDNPWPGICMQVLLGYIFVICAFLLHSDYGGIGVLAGIVMCSFKRLSRAYPAIYMIPTETLGYILALGMMICFWEDTIYAMPTALLVFAYKGRCMKKMPRWIGYAFYPVHMLVLAGIAALIARTHG